MVHRFTTIFTAAALAISAVTAQATSENLINGQCVQTYDASIDYFPVKLNTAEESATFFTVEYHNNYKVVENKRTSESIVLVQCGTPTPTNLGNTTQVYQIPITKAAVMETTVVPYLEMIGAVSSIDYIADGDLICSSCFQKYYTSGNISALSSTNETLQAEQINQVQIQFGYNPYATTTPIDANTTVTTAQSYEPDVLGRSSWIGYYASFYNLESTANNVSQTMKDNYDNLKKAASGYESKPVVAWTTYDAPSQYNNNTASYILSSASYKVGLTNDAGATMLNSSVSTFYNASSLLEAIASVDILIDETYIGSNLTDFMTNYQITDSSKFKFLTNKKVYREDGVLSTAGGYDWFEAPVAMADALLEDMINAVNPSAPTGDYSRIWLRNIALDEPIKYASAANCSWDENAPRPDLASQFDGGSFTLSSGAVNISPKQFGAALVSIATLAYLL